MFGHDEQDENGNAAIAPQMGQYDPVAQNDDQIVAQQDNAVDNNNDDNSNGGFVTTPESPVSTPPPAATDDLLDIKQEALQALTPLVSQLDQTPEEQFRTTMMMIQASDNHSLVRVAYDAAKQISNEKERAQALLDIVNEINYFTQHTQA